MNANKETVGSSVMSNAQPVTTTNNTKLRVRFFAECEASNKLGEMCNVSPIFMSSPMPEMGPEALGPMFSGCPSVCASVLGWKHSPTCLPSISS